MPRALRAITANECYHIINRGNQKARVFHITADYAAFLAYMREAQERIDLPLLAVFLMPNHVHLVVRPRQDADFASWISWLFTTHVRRHHRKYGTTGRLWQGRYKSCLIQQDHHLLTVLRYVERNALAGKLVTRAEDWRWGSLNWRGLHAMRRIDAHACTDRSPEMVDRVRESAHDVGRACRLSRESVYRQRPFGAPDWVETAARENGFEQSLAPIGRPRRKR